MLCGKIIWANTNFLLGSNNISKFSTNFEENDLLLKTERDSKKKMPVIYFCGLICLPYLWDTSILTQVFMHGNASKKCARWLLKHWTLYGWLTSVLLDLKWQACVNWNVFRQICGSRNSFFYCKKLFYFFGGEINKQSGDAAQGIDVFLS